MKVVSLDQDNEYVFVTVETSSFFFSKKYTEFYARKVHAIKELSPFRHSETGEIATTEVVNALDAYLVYNDDCIDFSNLE